MESLNLKVLPFVISAIIFSFLAFNIAIGLTSKIEIMLDLMQVFMFLIWLSFYISLTSIFLALTLSQINNIYYKVALFFLLLLPYTSIFILKSPIPLKAVLIIFVLFVGMAFTMLMEFNRLYSNQIKTDIATPARANAKTLTFFVALTTAIVFLMVNNNPSNQEKLENKILDLTRITITTAVEDYDLVNKLGGQMGTSQITQTNMGRNALNNLKPQINNYVADQVTAMITPYMPYIVYILTALIFATIAGASTLVGILTTLLGLLVVYILKSVGYLKEIKQTVEVTRMTM